MTDEKALDDACGKLGELLKPAYISTISTDVSGLVERLLVDAEYCADRVNPSIRLISCDLTEAADALASLSLQLAAVEGAIVAAWNSLGADNVAETIEDANFLSRAADGDLAEQISALVKQRDDAEASLIAAQEENERRREGLRVLATTYYKEDQHQAYAQHVLGSATLSTTSKEDKTDDQA